MMSMTVLKGTVRNSLLIPRLPFICGGQPLWGTLTLSGAADFNTPHNDRVVTNHKLQGKNTLSVGDPDVIQQWLNSLQCEK